MEGAGNIVIGLTDAGQASIKSIRNVLSCGTVDAIEGTVGDATAAVSAAAFVSLAFTFDSNHLLFACVSAINTVGSAGCGEGLVCAGVTPGPDVNLFRTRGSFFSPGLTGTDYNFGKFNETGGDKVLPAVIYLL